MEFPLRYKGRSLLTEILYALADILKSTDYALDISDPEEIDALTLYKKNGKPFLRDFCGNSERPAKPEEIVPQRMRI